tara:strand:+ start:1722 stop:1883 length:162 start_codon:yes stop_codon:yes gene_type:complete
LNQRLGQEPTGQEYQYQNLNEAETDSEQAGFVIKESWSAAGLVAVQARNFQGF